MHKTIYIEKDEEITGVIDKIRKEGAPEIFLVVPPSAMLTQGVINLKMLKKETDKIGKKIVLVTNDKHARKVIKDLGFVFRDRLSSNEVEDHQIESKIDDVDRTSDESLEELEKQEKMPRKEMDIGSSSFFEENAKDVFAEEFDEKEGRDVGDGQPLKPLETRGEPRTMEAIKNRAEQKRLKKGTKTRGFGKQKVSLADKSSWKSKKEEGMIEGVDFGDSSIKGKFSQKKAEDFFRHADSEKTLDKPSADFGAKQARKKPKIIFTIILVVLLGLLGFGGWAYFNWPQMDVVVYPRENSVNTIIEASVLTGLSSSDIDNRKLAGKLKIIEVEETVSYEASGEKFSSDKGKARGEVIIYNYFSSSPQPLVATTRVLSDENKLFRLINSVTVPGMDGDNPGELKVKVIADQPGEDFNIDPSTFTVEGFKGGPKYDKFEVKSDSPMTGGIDSPENQKVKYATENDINKARENAVEALESSLDAKIEESIEGEDEVFVVDSAKKEITESFSSREAGEIGEEVEYTVKENVKLITFSRKELEALARKALTREVKDGFELDDGYLEMEFIKNVADFEKEEMDIKLEISGVAWPKIDKSQFRTDIANEKESTFKGVLSRYPGIKKADIEYSPGWLSGMPVSETKINLTEKKERE